MPRRIESLFIDGPAGKLEALLEEPEDEDPRKAVVVCHPHPQHGGTMHNKVVYRIARGMRRAGAVVLRFNYRGVNLSDGAYDHGIGETEDARVALAAVTDRYPDLPLTIAGFSFGSRIALKLGCELSDISSIMAVGFPARNPDNLTYGHCGVPRFFIHSTNDQFGAVPEMTSYFRALPEPKTLVWVEARDHFFAGALDRFEEAVVEIARAY